MAYVGWLALAGMELLNNSRVAAYADKLAVPKPQCFCPELAPALGHSPYTDPKTDLAPWYDPAVPESERVAGFLGVEMVGFSRSTIARNTTPLFGDGSVPGPARMREREVAVKAILLAADECAASYGISWLATVLKGSLCSAGCLGDELCVLACCPPCDQRQPAQQLPGACPGGGPLPPPPDPVPIAQLAARRMYGSAILEGPEATAWRETSYASCTSSCGRSIAVDIDFTIVGGRPWLHREPVIIAKDCIIRSGAHVRAAGVPDCPELPGCLEDPNPPNPLCTEQLRPPLPPLPIDPCACTPLDQHGTIINVAPGLLPTAWEKVPIISVYAGSQTMRCLTIRWYTNPAQKPCADVVADPCTACAEVNISYLPAFTTLTLDGRTQNASVNCPGRAGAIDAQPVLYGAAGSVFQWPAFSCAQGMCIEVIADKNNLATDARVTVAMAVREDAI